MCVGVCVACGRASKRGTAGGLDGVIIGSLAATRHELLLLRITKPYSLVPLVSPAQRKPAVATATYCPVPLTSTTLPLYCDRLMFLPSMSCTREQARWHPTSQGGGAATSAPIVAPQGGVPRNPPPTRRSTVEQRGPCYDSPAAQAHRPLDPWHVRPLHCSAPLSAPPDRATETRGTAPHITCVRLGRPRRRSIAAPMAVRLAAAVAPRSARGSCCTITA